MLDYLGGIAAEFALLLEVFFRNISVNTFPDTLVNLVIAIVVLCLLAVPFVLVLKLLDFVCGGYTK